ncbi:MAG: hypothetical protein E6G92_07955 [Alphaproteobacteria bacterium]|nr:MAG: hypothetical protein E6G92_07955 [Alphaproteobacteria bacterium]
MRKIAILSLLMAAPGLAPAAASAQSSVTGPDITVTGDDRIICRRVTRTATRMRTGRICRTQAEWAHAPRERNATQVNANDTIDGAADNLDVLGEKVSTNCVGGMPGHSGGSGPY